MLTHLSTSRSPAILSVKVRPSPRRVALVVTQSPMLARAMGDYLREIDRSVDAVWMPTATAARNRLEWDHADTILVDSLLPEYTDIIAALHLANPEAQVQVIGGAA